METFHNELRWDYCSSCSIKSPATFYCSLSAYFREFLIVLSSSGVCRDQYLGTALNISPRQEYAVGPTVVFDSLVNLDKFCYCLGSESVSSVYQIEIFSLIRLKYLFKYQ